MKIKITRGSNSFDGMPIDYRCQICSREVNTWGGKIGALWVCHFCKLDSEKKGTRPAR